MVRRAGGPARVRVVAVAGAIALLLTVCLSAEAAITDKLVSRTSTGVSADGDSFVDASTAISHDGVVVAFYSKAANLPGGDGTTNQVYARNLETGKTKLLSRKINGDSADGSVLSPGISASGRFVAFFGLGNGLPGASGVVEQAWIADRKTHRVRLLSKANNGDPGDSSSNYPSVSADGRYVVFASYSSNLPGGDGVHGFVYVRDMERGRTKLVSRTNAGNPATGDVFGQSVSSDGKRIIFESQDPGLPAGDGTTEHIYARNMKTGRVSLVDRNSQGQPGNDSGYYPSISGSGRYVGFDSTATNVPPGDGSRQAYVRDLKRGKTILAGRNSREKANNGESYYPHLSGNGRYVVFDGTGSNMPGGDGSTIQIYVRDLQRGKTILLSKAVNGDPALGGADLPSISLDGRFATFWSGADNLHGNTSYYNVYRAGRIG
jgi:Tol biopolymer transport system component